MSNGTAVTPPRPFWLTRSTRTIFFFVVVLTLAGVYLALQVPISVFPETNFPRVVIGVDNGVMPVEQMQVTITKPIEDAVNSVPGLKTVRSTTSRGSAEISLFFDWNVDMFHQLQLVDAALGKVEQTLPSTAKVTTNRLTFATFPILGYSLTSDTVPQTQLWEIATYDLKPPLNRVTGVSTVTVQGGKVPEFHVVPNPALLQASNVTILDLANSIQASNIVDSPGLYEANHQLILGLVGAHASGRSGPSGRRGHGVASHHAGLYDGDRQRQAGGAVEHCPAAFQQHGRGGRRSGRAGGAAQTKTACGRAPGAVLRSIADCARQHQQRARRHFYRPDSGLHCAVSVFARLDLIADRRSGDSGDGGHHRAGALVDWAELQPDDAGRAGRGYRPCD
jgi:hypothetical protein